MGQRPQHRHRLRRREGQVIPDDGVTLPVIERPVGTAERIGGQRIDAVAEHGRHRRLGDAVASPETSRAVAKPSEAFAEPAAGGVAGLLVVRGQGRTSVQARVACSDVTGQVRVPVPGRELGHRQHLHHLPSRHWARLPAGVRQQGTRRDADCRPGAHCGAREGRRVGHTTPESSGAIDRPMTNGRCRL